MDSDVQGGVVIIFWNQPQGCSIKKTRFHGTNAMICGVFNGKRTPLIVAYPPPSTLEDLLDLAESLKYFRDQNSIVLEDLNANIQAQNPAIGGLLSC